MKEYLEEFFYNQMKEISNSESISKYDSEIEANKRRLKANLSKKQKNCF